MKKFAAILFFILLLQPLNIKAEEKGGGSLEQEFKRLNVDTALIVPSQGIDEYPLWSKDGNTVAANAMGEWYAIDLQQIELIEGTWRDNFKLGVINSQDSISNIEEFKILPWKNHNILKPRSFNSKNGTHIELKQEGMNTVFIVNKNGKKSEAIWASTFENCHSIVPSPDEKYIAFICEMDGVFVFKVP